MAPCGGELGRMERRHLMVRIWRFMPAYGGGRAANRRCRAVGVRQPWTNDDSRVATSCSACATHGGRCTETVRDGDGYCSPSPRGHTLAGRLFTWPTGIVMSGIRVQRLPGVVIALHL